VIEGYGTLFAELSEAVGRFGAFDVVLVPAGVGSFAAAAVRWAVHEQRDAAVVAVEPSDAACLTASIAAGAPVTVPTPGTSMAGLDCGTPSTVAWPTLRDGLAGTITVDDPPVHRAMRDLAALGLTIGDCGAAPLAALRALVTDPECAPLREAVGLGTSTRVLLLATEGASDPEAYARTLAGSSSTVDI
jgi:diaminopropionate ammonia-lyase